MTEAKLVNDALKVLRAHGAWAEKVHGGATQRRGLPDIVVVYRGVSIWLEAKVPGQKPTAIQLHILDELREHGAIAEWFDHLDAVERVLQSVDDRHAAAGGQP